MPGIHQYMVDFGPMSITDLPVEARFRRVLLVATLDIPG